MSSKIETVDRLFLAEIPELFNGKGWHGRGIPMKIEDFKDNEKVRDAIFPHKLVPTYAILPVERTTESGEKYMDQIYVETGDRIAVSLDNNKCIGDSVGKNYDTPQNEALLNLFREGLAGSNYEIVSVITVEGRVQFAIDAKYKENLRAAGRDVVPFVGLHRAFGGAGKLRICGHNTVMQCGNTTHLFIKEADASNSLIVVKNTHAIHDQLPLIKRSIEIQHGFQSEWIAAMEEAAKVKVEQHDARAAFVSMVANKELGTRSVNRANLLLELFRDGKQGNEGESLSDVYSAVTDLYTHHSAGSEDTVEDDTKKDDRRIKQFFSSEFGTAAKRKQDFTVRLFQLNGKGENRVKPGVFEEMVSVGNEIIDNSDANLVAALN